LVPINRTYAAMMARRSFFMIAETSTLSARERAIFVARHI
jgi:hypothetical protein